MRAPYIIILILTGSLRGSSHALPTNQSNAERLADMIRRKNSCPDIQAVDVPVELSTLVRGRVLELGHERVSTDLVIF